MAAPIQLKNRRTLDIVRILVFVLSLIGKGNAQHDSLRIPEVQVDARITGRPALREPGSITVVSSKDLEGRTVHSLLPALNLEPGVRMEERSPGSYRLSVRGSLLRSPFGIRNIKVYIAEIPLTNAAGETYLNLIDQQAVTRIEIHKGPDGSIFGANSGGVVRLSLGSYSGVNGLEGMAGSYGLYRAGVGAAGGSGSHRFTFRGAVQGVEGYREHSAMTRQYAHAGYSWKYAPRASLEIFSLASALRYETPGGLTKEQFAADPKQARPATATLPGAVAQAAGVHNLTGLLAVTNNLELARQLHHMVCLFGSVTSFSNPAISNYEERREKNGGFRTWLRYRTGDMVCLQTALGAEMQWHHSRFSNFVNNGGRPGGTIDLHEFLVAQHTLFVSAMADFYNRLLIEGSSGLNFNSIVARGLVVPGEKQRDYGPQLMPRVAASVFVAKRWAFRASVSRGYSAPTLQELRPVPWTFDYTLQPEHGWNYEAGVRAMAGSLRLDAAAFLFRLRHAITRQVDAAGNEYFRNAGQTRQPGLEIHASWEPGPGNRFAALQLAAGAQLYRFSFVDYHVAGKDFSGNRLTGVPASVFVGEATLPVAKWLGLRLQSVTVSRTPLDDANSAYSPAYTCLTAMIRVSRVSAGAFPEVLLSVGCDNVLDQRYTLGPDLNAFGGRFYNPAPGRNYFAQFRVVF